MGILSSIGSFLGNAAKTVVGGIIPGLGNSLGNIAGDYLGNQLDKRQIMDINRDAANLDRQSAIRQFRDRWKFVTDEGATITEALGLGPGSTAQGATQTMGNQLTAMTQQRRNERAAARERQLDREVQMRGQDAQVQASLGSAGIAANASMSNTRAQIDFQRETKLLSMGLDNLLSTATAQRFGVDPSDATTILNMSPAEFEQFVNTVLSQQSQTRKQTEGILEMVRYYSTYNAYDGQPLQGNNSFTVGPPEGLGNSFDDGYVSSGRGSDPRP